MQEKLYQGIIERAPLRYDHTCMKNMTTIQAETGAAGSGADALLIDILQARVLAKLFTSRTHDLVLKGGLAMRVAHASRRHTKDIDLDAAADGNHGAVRLHVRRAVRLAAAGTLRNVVITEPKQTDVVGRWKVGGTDPASGAAVHMTVEVSFREHICETDVQHTDGGAGGAQLAVYTAPVLALKKMQAFFGRDAVRDVADLYLLIKAHIEPAPEQLAAWMDNTTGNCDVLVNTAWDKLQSMDTAMLRAGLLPFVPEDDAQSWNREWDSIRVEVGTAIERWLRQAASAATPTVRRARP